MYVFFSQLLGYRHTMVGQQWLQSLLERWPPFPLKIPYMGHSNCPCFWCYIVFQRQGWGRRASKSDQQPLQVPFSSYLTVSNSGWMKAFAACSQTLIRAQPSTTVFQWGGRDCAWSYDGASVIMRRAAKKDCMACICTATKKKAV